MDRNWWLLEKSCKAMGKMLRGPRSWLFDLAATTTNNNTTTIVREVRLQHQNPSSFVVVGQELHIRLRDTNSSRGRIIGDHSSDTRNFPQIPQSADASSCQRIKHAQVRCRLTLLDVLPLLLPLLMLLTIMLGLAFFVMGKKQPCYFNRHITL